MITEEKFRKIIDKISDKLIGLRREVNERASWEGWTSALQIEANTYKKFSSRLWFMADKLSKIGHRKRAGKSYGAPLVRIDDLYQTLIESVASFNRECHLNGIVPFLNHVRDLDEKD